MSQDLMGLLALLNTSASGKKQSGNIESMIDYLMNPWLGVMSGGYDPLAGVSTPPARYKMDQIAADPEAPAALKSVAASISQGVPLYRVLVDIDALPDKGGMTGDELKSIAKQLDSEQQQFVEAQSKPGSDMFSKAGLPALTERYSDRPELAPLSTETMSQMQRLLAQSQKLRTQGEAGQKRGKQVASAEQKAFKDVAASYVDNPKMVDPKTGIEYTQNLSKNFDRGTWWNPLNWGENIVNTGVQALSRTAEDILGMSKNPGEGKKPKTYNKNWGDLSKKENLNRYLQAQAALQESNRLAAEAGRTQAKAVAKGEAQGRTPLMDMLAQRILASRLMGA